MKTIIMSQTIPLMCKTQEEIEALLQMGFKVKQLKSGYQYLIMIHE